jgi:GDPmannose 4,6-dehydratase
MTRALIVGSEGQDGRILFDRLTSEGCDVLGIGRKSLRGANAAGRETIDVTSRSAVSTLLREWPPDEIYYLPAVHQASEDALASDTNALLEHSLAVHVLGLVNFLHCFDNQVLRASLFYAASSLVFGDPESEIQDETTELNPRDIYGITKTAGIRTCRHYREYYDARASAGFLYNHESPLRGPTFISQKIARAAAAAAEGSDVILTVGNLSAVTDWGYAPVVVDALIRIVRQDEADDYIIATGEPHTVAEFAEIAFDHVGLDWRKYVTENPALLTRKSVTRIGNAKRLRERTGWKPTVTFSEMVGILVDAARTNAA